VAVVDRQIRLVAEPFVDFDRSPEAAFGWSELARSLEDAGEPDLHVSNTIRQAELLEQAERLVERFESPLKLKSLEVRLAYLEPKVRHGVQVRRRLALVYRELRQLLFEIDGGRSGWLLDRLPFEKR